MLHFTKLLSMSFFTLILLGSSVFANEQKSKVENMIIKGHTGWASSKTKYAVKKFTFKTNDLNYNGYYVENLRFIDLIPKLPKSMNRLEKRKIKKKLKKFNFEKILFISPQSPKKTSSSKLKSKYGKKFTTLIKQDFIPKDILNKFKNFEEFKVIHTIDTDGTTYGGHFIAQLPDESDSKILSKLKILGISLDEALVKGGSTKYDPFIIFKHVAVGKMQFHEFIKDKDKDKAFKTYTKSLGATFSTNAINKNLNKLLNLNNITFGLNSNIFEEEAWENLPTAFKHNQKSTFNFSLSADIGTKLGGNFLIDFSEEGNNSESMTMLMAPSLKFFNSEIQKFKPLENSKIEKLVFETTFNPKKLSNQILNGTGKLKINNKEFQVTLDIKLQKDKFPKINSIELSDNLTLNNFLNIPGTESISLNNIKISLLENNKGIKAKTKFFGMKNDIYLFEHDDNIVFAIDIEGKSKFNLSQILTMAKPFKNKTVIKNLKGFVVGKGALIFSKTELNVNVASAKGIAKDLFIKILGKGSKKLLKLNKITFIGEYDSELNKDKKIGEKIEKTFGFKENMTILGSVEGIFGKDPFKMKLKFLLDEDFDFTKLPLPKAFSTKKSKSVSIDEGMYLNIVDGDSDIGLTTGFSLSINKTEIGFDGYLGISLEEEDIGVSITGDIHDTIDNFAGIKHFQVNGGTVNTTIDIDQIKCGLELDTSFVGRTMSMAGDLVFATKGYPKGIGLKTYVSKLDKDGWKLLNYSMILGVPTLGLAGAESIIGGGVAGIIGAVAGGATGTAGGAAAGGGAGAVEGGVVAGGAGVAAGGVGEVVTGPVGAVGVGAAEGGAGAIIGGLATTGIVGAAGVGVGVVSGGVSGLATGFALGVICDAIIGNTKFGTKAMNKVTGWQANILEADEAYISFATPNAADADLGIPSGIHFNINNITLFKKYKKSFQPNFTGLYTLGNKITKYITKGEDFAKQMEKDFEKIIKKFEKKLKEKEKQARRTGKKLESNWKQMAAKEILKDFKFADDELKKAEKYAKKFANIFSQVMSVIHYELGLTKKKPTIVYKLTAIEKHGINELKRILNGLKLKDEKLGPIELKNAHIDIIPTLQIASDIKLFNRIEDKVIIEFNNQNKLAFDTTLEFKPFGKVDSEFILKDPTSIEYRGIFQDTGEFETWLENEIVNEVNSLFSFGDNILKNLSDDLKKAKKDVKNALKDLNNFKDNEIKYIDNSKAVKNAKKSLNHAISEFNSIKEKCENYSIFCGWHDCGWHGCKRKYCHPCKPYARATDDLIWAAKHYLGRHIDNPNTKKREYQNTKASVENNSYNPKLNKKQNIHSEAVTHKTSKQNAINDSGHYKKFKSHINGRVAKHIASIFEIKKISVVDEYDPFKPEFLLKMEYKLNKKDKIDYFIFKPYDVNFVKIAMKQFMKSIISEMLKDGSMLANGFSKEAKWFSHKIGAKLDKLVTSKEFINYLSILKSNGKKYKEVFKSMAKHTDSTLHSYAKKQQKHRLPSDNMSASKVFKNRYIAVAHSTLCLGMASNGIDVIQENCKDEKSERWSTSVLFDQDKKTTGYVQLKTKGLCLKAKTNNNKQAGDPLMLAQCNKKDIHEQWKVISKDGMFDKIVNRYSQMCLNFDTVNANPETAYAIWTSCLNVDSQGFRDIKDAQRPEMHKIKSKVINKNGLALSTSKGFHKYFKYTKHGHLTANSKLLKKIMNDKTDILIASKEKTLNDENTFNYLELTNGYIKIIHDKTGWCVAPKSHQNKEIVLKPCSKNDEMFWVPKEEREGGLLLKNIKHNLCLTLKKNNSYAEIDRCSKRSKSQLIDFMK